MSNRYLEYETFIFSSSSQRPQAQIGDRRQVDDIDRHQNQPSTPTSNHNSGPSLTPTVSTGDDLGVLPSGWQMSKTDAGRVFFIDHINKRTTWVRNTRDRDESDRLLHHR